MIFVNKRTSRSDNFSHFIEPAILTNAGLISENDANCFIGELHTVLRFCVIKEQYEDILLDQYMVDNDNNKLFIFALKNGYYSEVITQHVIINGYVGDWNEHILEIKIVGYKNLTELFSKYINTYIILYGPGELLKSEHLQ
jgi:hypothetical protein